MTNCSIRRRLTLRYRIEKHNLKAPNPLSDCYTI